LSVSASIKIALVRHRLEALGVDTGTGALLDRTFDVVLRHRRIACLLDCQCQSRIADGVSPPFLGGDGDAARELGEVLSAARVDNSLLVLDRSPF
jgi:hypothetical protein